MPADGNPPSPARLAAVLVEYIRSGAKYEIRREDLNICVAVQDRQFFQALLDDEEA